MININKIIEKLFEYETTCVHMCENHLNDFLIYKVEFG